MLHHFFFSYYVIHIQCTSTRQHVNSYDNDDCKNHEGTHQGFSQPYIPQVALLCLYGGAHFPHGHTVTLAGAIAPPWDYIVGSTIGYK